MRAAISAYDIIIHSINLIPPFLCLYEHTMILYIFVCETNQNAVICHGSKNRTSRREMTGIVDQKLLMNDAHARILVVVRSS